MKNQRKSLTYILILAFISAGIFWHIQSWQSAGRYAEMNSYLGTPRAALTVIYDIGVMLLFAGALGLLFSRIIDIITKK